MVAKGKILIGTSGFHYDHWKGPFYPEGFTPKDFLKFYARYFHTVELNNTFYRLPTQEMILRWKDSVPARFIFAVKASRYITHIKRLFETEDALKIFLERCELFGKKIGPILFQFPPHWNLDIERLAAFLPLLPKKYRYVFEFRDQHWFTQEVYDLLERFGAAFCIYDLGGKLSPKIVTADFVYIRFHGPSEAYAGKYPDKILVEWAKDISNWAKSGNVYCYFNNDESGYAAENGTKLAHMLSGT